jgi:hypothetical protein
MAATYRTPLRPVKSRSISMVSVATTVTMIDGAGLEKSSVLGFLSGAAP